MRSVKSTGGLTRGRGMCEAHRTQWLLVMPAWAEYSNAMKYVTGAGYRSCDQHADDTCQKGKRKQGHSNTYRIFEREVRS